MENVQQSCICIICSHNYYYNLVILTALSLTCHQHEPLVSLRSLCTEFVPWFNKWGADTVAKWFRVGEKADRLYPDVGPFSLSSCRGGSSLYAAQLSTCYVSSATINFFGFLYCNIRFIVSRDLFSSYIQFCNAQF